MLQSLVMLFALGQCPVTEVVVKPTLYIDYNLAGMTEVTRCMAVIKYTDGRKWRVPVINGYVPSINHTRYADGSERYHFDYSINLTYAEVMAKKQPVLPEPVAERAEPPKRPTLAPPKPIPDPVVSPEKAPPLEKLPVPSLDLPRKLEPVAPLPQEMNLPEPKLRVTPSYR